MKVQKKIKVSLSGSDLQCPVKVVAGDTAIQLVIEYIDFDIPSGTTATLYVRKPSKKFVYQTDDITISKNVVTIDVHSQAIVESGKAYFNVTLKNGEDTVSTFSNYFDIDRNYKDSIAEESKTIITEFDNLMEELRSIMNSSVITKDSNIPDYVRSEAKTVADKVVSKRDAYSFVFGAFSDAHTYGNDESAEGILHAGMGMNEIQKRTQLDALLYFGDVILTDLTGNYIEGFPYVKSCFDDVTKCIPYIQMQGNHDEYDGAYTEAEEKQKYFAHIGANNVDTVTDWNNRFRNYGYRDFESQKMRVIYLNSVDMTTIEKAETPIETDCHISGEQFKWFINTALNFSDKSDAENWSFIVSTHHDLNWYAWNAASPMLKLLAVLDAYKGKSSGSVVADNVTTQYDFTDAKAVFVAHFHGHLHNFRSETLGTNGVLTITIPNACFGRNNEYGTSSEYGDTVHRLCGDTNASGEQRQFNKTKNSSDDTSFNVVVIDRTNQKIHCFNYGAGIDREIDFDGNTIEQETPDVPVVPDEPDTPDEPTQEYTNIINTVGYTDDTRLSTSNGETKAQTGYVTTGMIDISKAITPVMIRTKNVDFSQSQSAIVSYNADGTALNMALVSGLVSTGHATLDSEGNLTLNVTTWGSSNVRLKLCGYGSGAELIVTLNQEIS